MKIGYARVSTQEQTLDVQIEQLKKLVVKKYIANKQALNHPRESN